MSAYTRSSDEAASTARDNTSLGLGLRLGLAFGTVIQRQRKRDDHVVLLHVEERAAFGGDQDTVAVLGRVQVVKLEINRQGFLCGQVVDDRADHGGVAGLAADVRLDL